MGKRSLKSVYRRYSSVSIDGFEQAFSCCEEKIFRAKRETLKYPRIFALDLKWSKKLRSTNMNQFNQNSNLMLKVLDKKQ